MTDYNKGYEKLEAAEKEIAYLKERYSDALDREKRLLAQLSLLQWTAIEEGNLPKVGDELWGPRTNVMILPAIYAPEIAVPNDFTFAGWTHFRKFNPPSPPTDKEQK